MLKTFGYHLFEENFSRYQCWPTSRGLRGFGPTILLIATVAWLVYPILMEIKNYPLNFGTTLVHAESIIMGVLLVSVNVQTLRHRDILFKMIYLLSDFKQFGKPKLNKFVEKNLRILLKAIHCGGYIFAHCAVATYFSLDDKCVAFKNTKYCLILPYYVPLDVEPWTMTLLLLLILQTIRMTFNTLISKVLMYCYTLELLTGRTEHLTEIIGEVNLTRNGKRNFNALRNIALYQQHIFELFQFTYNFFTSWLIPTKLTVAACISISCTDFFLRKSTTSLLFLTFTLTALFLIHGVGQGFTTANNKVAGEIFNLNWYEADISTRKFILLLFLISQKELKLESPLFGELSNGAAANEFKKVYVFFNWMSNVTTKRNFSF